MDDKTKVEIISGKAKVEKAKKSFFRLDMDKKGEYELRFKDAFIIRETDRDAGMRGSTYRVNGRVMEDLSFTKGTVEEVFERDITLRSGTDGVRFLYFYEDIPTFDSYDREWDGNGDTVIYKDAEGINLIYCRSGYKISEIEIYIGLTDAEPDFSEWLNKL